MMIKVAGGVWEAPCFIENKSGMRESQRYHWQGLRRIKKSQSQSSQSKHNQAVTKACHWKSHTANPADPIVYNPEWRSVIEKLSPAKQSLMIMRDPKTKNQMCVREEPSARCVVSNQKPGIPIAAIPGKLTDTWMNLW